GPIPQAHTAESTGPKDDDTNDNENGHRVVDGMELIATMVAANVRNARPPDLRALGLATVKRLADNCNDYVRLQRILPYTVAMLSDEVAIVRATAVCTLAHLVSTIERFPSSEAQLFN